MKMYISHNQMEAKVGHRLKHIIKNRVSSGIRRGLFWFLPRHADLLEFSFLECFILECHILKCLIKVSPFGVSHFGESPFRVFFFGGFHFRGSHEFYFGGS